MKIVIEDMRKINKFATIFCHLKPFTDNVVIYFKTSGLYIQCMDDSHCSLFECSLDKTWFSAYGFSEADDMPSISVNIDMLYKVLNTREEEQILALELDKEQEDQISISFTGGKMCKYFELPLINVDNDLLNTDKIKTTDIDLTIESKTFCDLINQLMIFDEVLTLTFKEDKIDMKSSGNDGSMKVEMNIDDLKEYAISEDVTLVQSYSLKYIQLMCQFNKLSNEITMGFSKDKPMTMRYDLLYESYVLIHLAPKIAED
uniref:Proliferating cell nuclear antigen PCNA N-terminal domain-containing protein n=1 Tax=viral metagenome TaxID=1070528 RepID=A0A6C0IL19_9ZZZZ